MKNFPSRIILCGFMGAGKTLVGRLLAQRLEYSFVDSDQAIEIQEKKSVREIFETYGENCFRSLESQILQKLVQQPRLVLSIGGGALLSEESFQLLNQSGELIFLKASLETVRERLQNDQSRPLLQGNQAFEKMTALFEQRKTIYDRVTYQVVTDRLSPDEIVEKIVARLSEACL